jgi:RHS repeat-associated protein
MPGRNYVSTIGVPFAYQGIEKDPETNLLNFELRQYDARLGRWYNPDPMGQHHSPYLAMSNNPVSSIDPDGGYDVNGGVNIDPTHGADDEYANAMFNHGGSDHQSFESWLNNFERQENDAINNSEYNSYKAKHKHGSDWGDYVTGNVNTTYGDTYEQTVFIVDPSKKIEDPHVNQNRLKFAKLSYEDSPWYRTKVDVFGSNALRSAWNSIIDLPETAKSLFTTQGLKNLFNTPDNLIVNSVMWFATTDNNQKAKDVVSASEDIAGGMIIGFGVGRLSTIGNGLKIGVNLNRSGGPKPAPFGCFTKGTQIWALDGSKNIEDVKVNDLVFAYDIKNKKVVTKKVLTSYEREVTRLIKLEFGNETIYTTSEHPFYINNNWVDASKLKVGDLLFLSNASTLPIRDIKVIDTTVKVYNFTVEDEHNYYVGISKVLVHNNNPCQNILGVHGNDLRSTKPTWGYKLYENGGKYLKKGITSKVIAEKRYTKAFMANKYMVLEPLFPNRKSAYTWEAIQERGPLNFNNH